MVYYWDVENEQVSFGWEWPDNITLVANSPTATTITGFTSLDTDQYAGQMLRVIDGNQAGYTYWVISNTATVLTVQGAATPNESGNAIEAGAKVAISTNGLIPSTYDRYIGVFKGGSPPGPQPDVQEHYGIGAKIRLASSVSKIDYKGGKIPLQLQSPELLMGLGDVWSEGTAKGGGASTTLSAAVYPWQKVVSVASAASISADDWLEFAGGTHKEVRKVASVDGTDITLHAPLEYEHANGQAVVEVETPFTITVDPSGTRPLRSITLISSIVDPDAVQGDKIFAYKGVYISQADFKGVVEKELMVDLQLWGMDYEIDPNGVTTPTIETDLDEDGSADTFEFTFWDDNEISINSVLVAIPQSATITWSNNLKILRALGGGKGKKPYRIESHKFSGTSKVAYNPVNDTILDDLKDPSELDGSIKFVKDSNNYLEFTLTDGRAKGEMPWPEQDRFECTFTRLEEQIVLTIKTECYIC